MKTSNCVLETTRLRLQPCQIEDLPLVHRLWTHEQIRYFLFDDRVISLNEVRSFIELSLKNFEKYGYGLWIVFAYGIDHLVGFAGCLRSSGTPSLIYGVDPDLWGRGYATEAARAVLSYILEELVLPKVEVDVDEPNVGSIRVLKKLGMRQIGHSVVKGHPLVYFELCSGDGLKDFKP